MRYWRTADRRHVDNFLVHHGIEGQKWGVSHGPPYPLGSKVSTGHKLIANLPHKRIAANRMGKYTKKQQARISEAQVTGGITNSYITKKAINQGYTEANLNRIQAAQRMGARVAGLPGQLIGASLAKKHINAENAGERPDKYTDEERVRINNAFSMYGLTGTALSRHNVKKENKQAAQKEALSIVDNMDGFNKEDFEIASTKRTKDGNNYIIEVQNKDMKDIKAYVKVTKDKDSGAMSITNIGLTEEDAKSGSKESNAEKIKAKADSYGGGLSVKKENTIYMSGNQRNNNPTKEDKDLNKTVTSEGYGKWILDEAAEANGNDWPTFEKYTDHNATFIDTKNKASSISFNSKESEIKKDKKSGAVNGEIYTRDVVSIPISNDGNYDMNRNCEFSTDYYDAYDGEFLGSKKSKA